MKSKGGPVRPGEEKTPGDHVAKLHLFDEEARRRAGPALWLSRHPGLLVAILLLAAAPVVFRALLNSSGVLTDEPAPAEPVVPLAAAEEPPRFRHGLTPLPDAAISSPVNTSAPITVRAIGADGAPLTGALVRFSVSQGAGTLNADSARTDGAGLARVDLALPARSGRTTVVAGLVGSPLPGATFTVTALSGAPRQVAIVQGNRQQADAGALLPDRLGVRVTDGGGNPVRGVEVRFRVMAGNGEVAPERTRTDSAGQATAFWRLGASAGEQRVAAIAPDADADFLTFIATARAEAQAQAPPAATRPPTSARNLSNDSVTGIPTLAPVLVAPQSFAVGGNFVCAIPGGDVSCRGANDRGQRASEPGTSFVSIVAGLSHGCGLTNSGEASCWGANESGQLGDGSRADRAAPVGVSTELRFSRLVAGAAHTCGLAGGGRALCWGNNLNGQLGDGSREDRTTPTPVASNQSFARLVAGWSHTCASDAGGDTYCWGLNDHGQLGDGTGLDRLVPARVAGTFESLVAGSAHTCGIRAGQVYCWGNNGFGQLGDGTTADHNVPTPVQGLPGTPARLAAGAVSTCALLTDGSAWCWGQNLHGQLGDGTTQSRSAPVRVSGDYTFRSLFAGGALTCGFAADGLDYCWGLNQSGQLGDGSRVSRSVPTRVGG